MSRFHRYDYLLSVLPGLEPIGSIPPMSKSELLEHVVSSNGPVSTVEILLLYDDLGQYQALMAEEIKSDQTDFALLSLEKAENDPVLPTFLLSEETSHKQENRRKSIDEIWSRYFYHAALVAKSNKSVFLKSWIGFEVGLHNALANARCQILGLDSSAYLVAPELSDKNTDYSSILSAWSSARNPLEALEVLDKVRWDWLEENGQWYSCSPSEMEVYAAKLILLHHWRRILSENK
ncbi:DUF2764 family protein [Planctomycetota bacterium]